MILGYLSIVIIVALLSLAVLSGWPTIYLILTILYFGVGGLRFLKGYAKELPSQRRLGLALPRLAFSAVFWPFLVLMIGW